MSENTTQIRQPARPNYIDFLISRLRLLSDESDPGNGALSERGKDLRAFEALETAGQLVRELAGWAICHTVGLAKCDLKFVPLQPSQTKKHREYLEVRAKVDSHVHEAEGVKTDKIVEPHIIRRLLINLLTSNSGGWPYYEVSEVALALEGVNFGERSSIFEPVTKGHKVGLHEQRLQLRAVCLAEYRRGLGLKKASALTEVARAFVVDEDTIVSWEKRLRKNLGNLEVSRSIAFARNRAKNAVKNGDLLYGDEVLRQVGKEYREFRKTQKLRKSQKVQSG